MGRGYAIGIALLSFAFCTACRSGTTYVSGNEVDREVKEILSGFEDHAAALSTGRTIYLVPAGELVAERRKLLGTLAGADVVAPRSERARDPGDRSPAEVRVMAFTRPQVFEASLSAGTLHVERIAEPGQPPSHYAVSIIEPRRVLTSRLQVSARLEGAWRALFEAARRAGRTDPRFESLPSSLDRPLNAMRQIGVDYRGIEAE